MKLQILDFITRGVSLTWNFLNSKYLNLIGSLQVRGGECDQWAGDMYCPGDGDEASKRK